MSKKIVHVLGAMDVGGTETWLMSVLRSTNPIEFKHEFIVHRSKNAYFDEELISLGSKKYVCQPDNIFKYSINLFKTLKKIRPHVVHSHVSSFSGIVLAISWLAGVKIRISHSHNDQRMLNKKESLIRKGYFSIMDLLLKVFSTTNISASENAAISLYGVDWHNHPNNKIIFCGIDYDKFKNASSSIDYHNVLNIPRDSIVLGHVGSFTYQKNHQFLLKIFSKLLELDKKYYLVLLGDGVLKPQIQTLATDLNIDSNVRFMGNRSDVPEIMNSLFDIFLFPSYFEGLGLAAVEAQMTGLPVLASDCVPFEADCGSMTFLELNEETWIRSVRNCKKNRLSNNKCDFGRFSLENNINQLKLIYE